MDVAGNEQIALLVTLGDRVPEWGSALLVLVVTQTSTEFPSAACQSVVPTLLSLRPTADLTKWH